MESKSIHFTNTHISLPQAGVQPEVNVQMKLAENIALSFEANLDLD